MKVIGAIYQIHTCQGILALISSSRLNHLCAVHAKMQEVTLLGLERSKKKIKGLNITFVGPQGH